MVDFALTLETILFFIGFIIVLVILYKLFKTVVGALLAGLVGLLAPWVLSFIHENLFTLPFEISPSFELSIQLALLAVVLYLVLKLFKAGKSALKLLTPGRRSK